MRLPARNPSPCRRDASHDERLSVVGVSGVHRPPLDALTRSAQMRSAVRLAVAGDAVTQADGGLIPTAQMIDSPEASRARSLSLRGA
jgi:hypothetical protein